VEPKDDLRLQSAFLAAEDKPKAPLAILWVIWRATRDDTMCTLSRQTIADRSGYSLSTVKREIKNLIKLGWITKISGKKRSQANRYQVELAQLPYDDLKPTIVSEKAKEWAKYYHDFLLQHPSRRGKKRIPAAWKGWQQRWAFTFEGFRKKSGYDAELILGALGAALKHPRYFKRAWLGPDHLKGCWWELVAQVAGAEKARKLREDQKKQSKEMVALARKLMTESSGAEAAWEPLRWPSAGAITPWAPRRVEASVPLSA
jgi:hypothetical protein